MSEYVYRQEINLIEIADEYAKRIQERVDEIALDKAAGTLARYGYVKIIRCRDCEWLVETDNPISSTGWWCVQNDTPRSPDGFCDWGERRDA